MALWTLLALFPLLVAAGDRAFTVRNDCTFTIWPAIANYPVNGSTLYEGTRGWEAAGGSEQQITIPAGWNGRIWARLGCTKNGNKLSCKFGGDLASDFEPKDNGMGNTNLFEINLSGDLDWWDISAVPGFGTTMSVTPTDVSCDSAECTKDLNPDCPSDLAVQGDDGANIGCLSACNAKINADTPSYNCCSGELDNRDLCTKDHIDYYAYFKEGCTHAYAYPFDDGTNDPPVVFTCSPAKESGYTITFCPGGSGGDESNDSTTTSTLGFATSADENTLVLATDAKPSGSATSSADASSAQSTASSTSASSHAEQGSSGGGGATATGGTTAALSKTSSTAAEPSGSSPSDTTDDGTILGPSSTAFAASAGGLVLIAIAGVFLCVCMRRKKKPAYGATSSQPQTQGQSTTTAASLAHGRPVRRSSRRAAASAYSDRSSEASSEEGEMNSSDEERELMREIRHNRSTERSASRSGRV